MNALEISEVYMRMAKKTRDVRWKRYLLQLAGAFAEEWFGVVKA